MPGGVAVDVAVVAAVGGEAADATPAGPAARNAHADMADTAAAAGSPRAAHPRPYVREELDAKSLHFSMAAIQSRMQIRRPDALELDYTRTMMAFLLFAPEPARIAMIGLGGGSLAKFCHRHLPRSALTVIEINPHVIALREAFCIPADGPRFRVIEADGARFVRDTDARFDVLLIDAFDAHGLPAALGTQRFYDDCLDVLAPAGVFVANLHAGNAELGTHLDRMRRCFGRPVLRVDDADGTNCVVFARKGAALEASAPGPARRPAALAAAARDQLSGAFTRVRSALAA